MCNLLCFTVHAPRLLARGALLAALLLVSFRPPAVGANGAATVRCRLETDSVDSGAFTTLYIEILNATNLYGYQMEVTFDPAGVQLLDGDLVAAGDNFTLGSFLSNDFVVLNTIDNGAGVAELAVTQTQPRTPQSGSGELARAVLRGEAPGQVDITLDSIILSDNFGTSLPFEVENCSLLVNDKFVWFLPLVLN